MAAKKANYIFRQGQNPDGTGPRNNPSKTEVREWGTEREDNESLIFDMIQDDRDRLTNLESSDTNTAGVLSSLDQRLDVVEGATGTNPDAFKLSTIVNAGTAKAQPAGDARFGYVEGPNSLFLTYDELVKAFQMSLDQNNYYPQFKTVMVSTETQVLIGADPTIRRIDFQSALVDVIVACPTGQVATLGLKTPGVATFNSASGRIDFGPKGAEFPISFIGSGSGEMSLCISRTTDVFTEVDTFGDNQMARWPNQNVDPRFKDAMRIALNKCKKDGLINADGTGGARYAFIKGLSTENDLINLFAPNNGKTQAIIAPTGGVVSTPYGSLKGNALDIMVDTGHFAADLGLTGNEYFFACLPDSAIVDSNGLMMGMSTSQWLQPNNTASASRARSGAAPDPIAAAAGSWIASHRDNAATYKRYVNGQPAGEINRAGPATPSQSLKLLYAPVTGGNSYTKLGVRLAFAGGKFNDPDTAMNNLYQNFQPVIAVMDQIRAGV